MSDNNQGPIKLRWLIAHQPAYLFERTATAFAEELDKMLPGQFEIEILKMGQYIKKYGDIPELQMKPGTVPGIESLEVTPNSDVFKPVEWKEISKKWDALFQGMRDGKIHLSQTQVTVIGNQYKKFLALDLPFLFDDHDHVTRVLDGEIGDSLCEELGDTTNVKGLAFTYSGGYRIVGSNNPITSLNAMKKIDITTVPMTRKLFEQFNLSATSRMNQKIDETAESIENGGAIETTYLRFAGKNILKTNHSMFLTTILVGGPFFESLTTEQQVAFKKAAKIVAKLERKWSLEDAQKYEDNAKENGITINELSIEESTLMKEAAPKQYKSAYIHVPGSKDLVDKIKKI